MARLTSYNNFVKGEEPKYNQPKPYIYVLKYIISKENNYDELRDYILNYSDDNSDYDDDKTYDQFMKTLKIYAMGDRFYEIEEMVFNHDEFEYDDFDESEDLEEKMYYKDGFAKSQEVYFDAGDSIVSDIIEDFIEDDSEDYNSRIEELDKMEDELFSEEDLRDKFFDDDDEFNDLEEIDGKIHGIDIDFEEVNDSDEKCEKGCEDCDCENSEDEIEIPDIEIEEIPDIEIEEKKEKD